MACPEGCDAREPEACLDGQGCWSQAALACSQEHGTDVARMLETAGPYILKWIKRRTWGALILRFRTGNRPIYG